jgi:hypothetical protein
MKKIISRLLIIIVVFGTTVCTPKAQEGFSDLPSTHWAYNHIQELVNINVINGFPDGHFYPNQNVTAEQFLKMVVSVIGYPDLPSSSDNPRLWAAPYIEKAYELGLIKSTSSLHDIDWAKAITREVAADLAVKGDFILHGTTFDSFQTDMLHGIPDVYFINNQLKPSVYSAYSLGMITGYDDHSFKPKGFLTRAEASTIIMRIIDLSKREPYTQTASTATELPKTRVIAMTDGEGDDRASMVRFLFYANEMDIEAIIQTNSYYQLDGNSQTTNQFWLEDVIEAYGKDLNNLRVHDPTYPDASELLEKHYLGHENRNDVDKDDPTAVPPFGSTPGSERIIDVLLDDDPRPVWIQAWGGLNTAAEALYQLKYSGNYTEADYQKAAEKARIFSITFQDNSGNYIREHFPEVLLIRSMSFDDTYGYTNKQDQWTGEDWVTKYLYNHGNLASRYTKLSILEGDTPSFLNAFQNGLRASEDPTYGGWGGRFITKDGSYYSDAKDGGSIYTAVEKYIPVAQNDFAARLDWANTDSYSEANHHPVIELDGPRDFSAKAGDDIELSARNSYDPDEDDVTYTWYQHKEADTTNTSVTIQNKNSITDAYFIIPQAVKAGETIHIILEATDNGNPKLTRYERLIIHVE